MFLNKPIGFTCYMLGDKVGREGATAMLCVKLSPKIMLTIMWPHMTIL